MHVIYTEGGGLYPSEARFIADMETSHGVLLANANLASSVDTPNDTREVDAIVITPHGIYTTEVKGTSLSGDLVTPNVAPWCVNGPRGPVALAGNARLQALQQSKRLASFLKSADIECGWVPAVLAYVGDGIRLPRGVKVHYTNNVFVVVSNPEVGTEIDQDALGPYFIEEISIEKAHAILTALGYGTMLPDEGTLRAEGFQSDDDIKNSTERWQNTSGRTKVQQAPTTTDLQCTEDRHAATMALDPELCRTFAVVDGVGFSRVAASQIEGHGLNLIEASEVYSAPDNIIEESATREIRVKGKYAVQACTLTGLVDSFGPAEFMTRFHTSPGVTKVVVDGVTITQRALAYGLSYAAVARIVNDPEESWWSGNSNSVKHARGDYVAVTRGPENAVVRVTLRALAVQEALESNAEEPDEDIVIGEITVPAKVRAEAMQRRVSDDDLRSILTHPESAWDSELEGFRIHVGRRGCLIIDTNRKTVTRITSRNRATMLREGCVYEDVQFSPALLVHLTNIEVQRGVARDIMDNPIIMARNDEAQTTVYVNKRHSLFVHDTRGAIDIQPTRETMDMIRRGDTYKVKEHWTAGENRPTPRMFARMANRAMGQ